MFPPGMCRLFITVQSPPAIVVVLFDAARDILERSRPVLAPKSAPEPPANSPCAARMMVVSDHLGAHVRPSVRTVTVLDAELVVPERRLATGQRRVRHAVSRRTRVAARNSLAHTGRLRPSTERRLKDARYDSRAPYPVAGTRRAAAPVSDDWGWADRSWQSLYPPITERLLGLEFGGAQGCETGYHAAMVHHRFGGAVADTGRTNGAPAVASRSH